MPEVVHDGAARWREYYESSLRRPIALPEFLKRYFDLPKGQAVNGIRAWDELIPSLENRTVDESYWVLDEFRGLIQTRAQAPNRVFVSHRQSDAAEATDLAHAIQSHGRFDVWLDVWDPGLTRKKAIRDTRPLLTALIIEMGLINSIAVIALMTNKAHGSNWIPYEFGRVKTGGPFARQASICLRDHTKRLDEYMYLGPRIEYVTPGHYAGLDSWLDHL